MGAEAAAGLSPHDLVLLARSVVAAILQVAEFVLPAKHIAGSPCWSKCPPIEIIGSVVGLQTSREIRWT